MSHAVQLCGVPKLAVIRRKSCGQAYINMGGGRDGDEMTACASADVSFMDRRIRVGVLDGSKREDDPARRVAKEIRQTRRSRRASIRKTKTMCDVQSLGARGKYRLATIAT
jgi:acetyl-CoA carboxylase carboxyltransferase component